MLITNYGIDNAFCRVVYNLYGDDVGITISSRYLQDYLENDKFYLSDKQLIFCGFYKIEDQLLRRVKNGLPTTVISTYKMTFDNNMTINDPDKSRTMILAELLKVKDDYVLLLSEAARHINTENDEFTDLMLNFYDAIGHEEFIARFTNYPNLKLTKVETEIAELARDRKIEIANLIISNSDYYLNEDILVVRSGFGLRRFLKPVIEEKFTDLNLIIFWDVSDVLLKLQIYGSGLSTKELVDFMGGSYWNNSGNVELPLPDCNLTDEYVYDLVTHQLNILAENKMKHAAEESGNKILETWLNDNIFK